jgi:HlyD family secretion protein
VLGTIFVVVALIATTALLLWRPWQTETTRFFKGGKPVASSEATTASAKSAKAATPSTTPTPAASSAPPETSPATQRSTAPTDGVVLTVSGYIINRERIELSPRFMGQVRWIGVKKGDAVTNGQVVVLLDDTEYQAQRRELAGRMSAAEVQVRRAQMELNRMRELAGAQIETQRALDLANLDLESAQAETNAIAGQLSRIQTWIDWTVIRSPINGVVLEKLVDPNELVTPQSFGGNRGPSTALMSVGDPQDLQVEIDLSERDLSKVTLGQKCQVRPEAFKDHVYEGYVAEMAPEASRQKGTLQIKVQIKDPDRFLTPELSAQVDFLARQP